MVVRVVASPTPSMEDFFYPPEFFSSPATVRYRRENSCVFVLRCGTQGSQVCPYVIVDLLVSCGVLLIFLWSSKILYSALMGLLRLKVQNKVVSTRVVVRNGIRNLQMRYSRLPCSVSFGCRDGSSQNGCRDETGTQPTPIKHSLGAERVRCKYGKLRPCNRVKVKNHDKQGRKNNHLHRHNRGQLCRSNICKYAAAQLINSIYYL